MKRTRILLALLLILTLVAALTVIPCAAVDFGDFSGDNDFDFGGGGGDYDYGGSDSDGDSDGSGSLIGILLELFCILPWPLKIILILVVIVIFAVIVLRKKNNGSSASNAPVRMQRQEQAPLRPMSEACSTSCVASGMVMK